VILSSRDFAAEIRRRGIDTLFLTTALFNQIARELPEAFAPLEHLLFGGEAADPSAVNQVLEKGRPRRLVHVYGPTESTTFASWKLIEEVSATAATVSIGRAISNTRLYILDQHLNPVPIGVTGELCIGGNGLARGYIKHPELTAERFIPDPIGSEPGARLYKTGDLTRWLANGEIEFVRRNDFQIKMRGFRIEPGEIETVLRQHKSVREAIVVARTDARGDAYLSAYVVAPELTPTAGELRAFLKEKLPEYMLPSVYLPLDKLPLTPHGKVDRRALPQPDRGALGLDVQFVAPRSAIEEVLSEIFAEVLRVERVGVNDSFFELGGHSLLATQIVTRVRKTLQSDLPLRKLFEAPTVASLATVLVAGESNPGELEKRAETLRRTESLTADDLEELLRKKRANAAS
jgi:acyl-CoA synthetase (AMP-forming)/AMP-acid ligase II/acyl carrier protein